MKAKTSEQAQLLALMEKYSLSCPEVADLVGVHANTVRKWRCGMRRVPLYALRLISLSAA